MKPLATALLMATILCSSASLANEEKDISPKPQPPVVDEGAPVAPPLTVPENQPIDDKKGDADKFLPNTSQ